MRQRFTRTMVMLLVALLVATHPGYVSAACPWDNDNLVNWDDTGTWDDGNVPEENAQVVIPSGRHVLLNAQPAKLTTVTIQADASLVWGNVDGLELSVEYLLVDGAFHMGADDCRLEKRATIKLRGRNDSEYHVDDQRKMVMVREGATIEIHGKVKTPWTNLARSIRLLSDLDCQFVYDHSDLTKNPFAAERQAGLHVIVWNEDATVFDYAIFSPDLDVTYSDLKDFVEPVPDGKVIGMYAFGDAGLGRRSKSRQEFSDLEETMAILYSDTQISNVDQYDSYAFLTRKGSGEAQEYYVVRERRDKEEPEAFLSIPDFTRDIDFQVAKSAQTKDRYFRVMYASASYPVLELAENVTGWEAGDKIVVTSTDFNWEQAEVREIVECSDCSASQIRVNESFVNRHYGNFTYHIDERAEVGLLSRNILIEGEMEETCPDHTPALKKLCKRFGEDTFGGHVKMLKGHLAAHIQGVELYHVGQQTVKGSYPLHFHMCDVVSDSWVKDNSIHQSFSRCVTIHGTDNLTVSGIVCYKHLGHGFFLEDSVEQDNLLYGNLGIGTKSGTLLLSDSTRDWCKEDYRRNDWSINCDELATYWITHPNNNFTNNVAAGGEGHGYMFVFADLPLAISYDHQQKIQRVPNYTVKHFPVKAFYKNVAHSYKQSGIFFDSIISTGKLEKENGVPENGIIQTENDYDPRDPPGDVNGSRVWTKLERVTAYRNGQENLWVKGGNINITFASIADAPEGFAGGCTGFWTGTSLEYSVAIGRTDNLGMPQTYSYELENGQILKHHFDRSYPGNPQKTWTGTSIYQAPMYVKHSYFDRYYHWYWNDSWTEEFGKRPVSLGAGISFKKDSTYPTYASQYTTNVSFGYCDDVDNHHWVFHGNYTLFDWQDKDGTRNAHTVDRDGSLTGTPNTTIVQNRRFFTGDQCTPRPDWGSLAMCPYRYIKMEILGRDGNLGPSMKTKWPIIVHRDDEPDDAFEVMGEIRREFLLQTYRSYLVDFNTTVEGAAFPTMIKFVGSGVETQDVVRVGVCVPMGLTDFHVDSDYPVPLRRDNFTKASSLAELDADQDRSLVYHDEDNGIIFFKIWSKYDRTNDSQLCTYGLCYTLKLTFNDGDFSSLRSCFGAQYDAFTDPRPVPAKPTKPPCPELGSPEGLGAIRWDEVSKIVSTDFNPTCQADISPPALQVNDTGCFVKSSQAFETPQVLKNSMTQESCALRCHRRGKPYGGLLNGNTCVCMAEWNNSAEHRRESAKKCSRRCAGNSAQYCGSKGHMEVIQILAS